MNLYYLTLCIPIGFSIIILLSIGISFLMKKGLFYKRNQKKISDETLKLLGLFYVGCSIPGFITLPILIFLSFI